MKTWCEHIEYINGEYRIKFVGTSMDAKPFWSFCPECGATRPKDTDEREILIGMLMSMFPDREGMNVAAGIILEKFTLRKS